ncbi:hypothetical protein Zmor_008311 [Zophobas morio]|uniref:Fibrinogen C-terminal domain-containing protein n=1 Tax=Zophobas morio TaxID=2755281 RepID=A0AA38MQL2_9CUCU|nr:hypothetical protein Zmor_008311 [Zophobas morio]
MVPLQLIFVVLFVLTKSVLVHCDGESFVKKSSFTYPKHCDEVMKRGYNRSGFYFIQPKYAPYPFPVVCHSEGWARGWTVILNRFEGSQNFSKTWEEYQYGFGNVGREYWLGLENIHYLTGYDINELRVELTDAFGTERTANYKFFSVGSAETFYTLKLITGHSGDAPNSMSLQGGARFSTVDNDQDESFGHCAWERRSGWWYRGLRHWNCSSADLNGLYSHMHARELGIEDSPGMHWKGIPTSIASLKEARMMVRPRPSKGQD